MVALRDEVKTGESFLSLHCKDSTPYPLPPLYLYRSSFMTTAKSKHANKMREKLPSTLHALHIIMKMVWENCLRHLDPSASAPMPFIWPFIYL